MSHRTFLLAIDRGACLAEHRIAEGRSVRRAPATGGHVVSADELQTSGQQDGSGALIRDWYARDAPSPQQTVDIFKGEWASLFPPPFDEVRAGGIPLWEDTRVSWCEPLVGGFAGKRVLELGPLEGSHTYMLESGGAVVTAVEANTRAYLKCLIFKEIVGLKRARFLCGDFVEYLRGTPEQFDVCFASGVLYHMREPAELIALVAKVADKAFFWTHYYDDRLLAEMPQLRFRRTSPTDANYGGFRHRLYRQDYPTAAADSGFCGGPEAYSQWMTRADILACCEHFGFSQVVTGVEQPDHQNGPAFAFVASRGD